MKLDPHSGQLIGAQFAKVADRRNRRVLRVIGLDPGVLQTRHVRKMGEVWPRLERRDIGGHELREILAIGDHDRRARLAGAGEGARHGPEQVVAHDPARHGIARFQGADQSDGDVVAVNRKPACVRHAKASAGRRGRRGRGIGKRRRKSAGRRLKRHRRAPRLARSRRPSRARRGALR